MRLQKSAKSTLIASSNLSQHAQQRATASAKLTGELSQVKPVWAKAKKLDRLQLGTSLVLEAFHNSRGTALSPTANVCHQIKGTFFHGVPDM